ncbi:MAG: sugar phosphate isomerase/epimerase [Kiritimatiellae bacterium]|nr:sugar phosphate isomerase/epimerase [Kiritimatiellia bacterium]
MKANTSLLKLGSNLCPFSRLSDRFVTAGYCRGYKFEKQLELLAGVKGISGTGYGWPGAIKTGAALRRSMDKHGLKLVTLDVDIYTDARFKLGSLTNPDPKIRRAAIARVKAALDAAEEAGSPDINLWPGHDGFDYFFQGHYTDAWKWMAEGISAAADYNPRVPISIEYKCKEPRANTYLANAGKALWLVSKIARPQVGITLDVGHSLAALENPAECAALALSEGRLQQIHVNDNYRDWDHDMIPGAVNVWDFIEFFYWTRKLGYRGWYCIDSFPYREDGTQALQRASQVCHTCWNVAGELIAANIEPLLRNRGHLEIMRRLWNRFAS